MRHSGEHALPVAPEAFHVTLALVSDCSPYQQAELEAFCSALPSSRIRLRAHSVVTFPRVIAVSCSPKKSARRTQDTLSRWLTSQSIPHKFPSLHCTLARFSPTVSPLVQAKIVSRVSTIHVPRHTFRPTGYSLSL